MNQVWNYFRWTHSARSEHRRKLAHKKHLLSIVLSQMDNGNNGTHLPSCVSVGSSALVPKPYVLPRLRCTHVWNVFSVMSSPFFSSSIWKYVKMDSRVIRDLTIATASINRGCNSWEFLFRAEWRLSAVCRLTTFARPVSGNTERISKTQRFSLAMCPIGGC